MKCQKLRPIDEDFMKNWPRRDLGYPFPAWGTTLSGPFLDPASLQSE